MPAVQRSSVLSHPPTQDIQTSSFIAQVLEDGNVSPKYLPALVTLLGFFISFATGSVREREREGEGGGEGEGEGGGEGEREGEREREREGEGEGEGEGKRGEGKRERERERRTLWFDVSFPPLPPGIWYDGYPLSPRHPHTL